MRAVPPRDPQTRSSGTEDFDTKWKTVTSVSESMRATVMRNPLELHSSSVASMWCTTSATLQRVMLPTPAKIHTRPECIRQRVQKIMNTMCGRRNIDEIVCAGSRERLSDDEWMDVYTHVLAIRRGDCGASTDREGREGLTANHGTISNILAHEARPMLRIAERYTYRFVWPPAKF